ncbi:hypothetical protein [Alkalicoccus urumqiensis]|uniref:PD-(D/E)XK nuclease family protein n=1 Tax=Alkalicoccus urumqiensis TaxID=1548213 RepID=A0A2P6MJR7_ALKUR|nr:hypothetical protein [Alkalicoccus urumqiensis]PRO66517.1 hypothetical protein C6I21_04020 [Alkalicoccus urumqiensis]
MRPNLFDYAGSELSQDAFFCWLFAHLEKDTPGPAADISREILTYIHERAEVLYRTTLPNLAASFVTVERQVLQIDILLTCTCPDTGRKTAVILEDKTESGESRPHQPEYYARRLEGKRRFDHVIPVLLKTGFTTKSDEENYALRGVVFIGRHALDSFFQKHEKSVEKDVILSDWRGMFQRRYLHPADAAETWTPHPEDTLPDVLEEGKAFPPELFFTRLTEALFPEPIASLTMKTHRRQGAGHADWHLEWKRPSWISRVNGFSVRIYFIWDGRRCSLVVKTAPHPYRSKKRLRDEEQAAYEAVRSHVQQELDLPPGWKRTNHFLQTARFKELNEHTIHHLQQVLPQHIRQIAASIDQALPI